MGDKKTIKDLLTEEVKDLYSAEKQLTKAIPKMARGSKDTALKNAFNNLFKETHEQVLRLETIGQTLGITVRGKKCLGMEGVIQDSTEVLGENGDHRVVDLGIIGAGSRVEHYQMAGYLTAISLARRLGKGEVVALLKDSLAEEQGAEKTLRKTASGLMKSAQIDAP